jgi:hypothetical protein
MMLVFFFLGAIVSLSIIARRRVEIGEKLMQHAPSSSEAKAENNRPCLPSSSRGSCRN